MTTPARESVESLLTRSQVLLARYSQTGMGKPDGLPDLNAAIDVTEAAYDRLGSGDRFRALVAFRLGWLRAIRYLGHTWKEDDRERGIVMLREALTYPHLPPALDPSARTVLGALYFARTASTMPAMMSDIATLMRSGIPPGSKEDLDQAQQCFQQVLATASVNAEVTRTAKLMLPMVEAMQGMLEVFAPGPIDLTQLGPRLAASQAAMQRIQDGMGDLGLLGRPGGVASWVANLPPMPDLDLTDVDPIDRPALVIHDTEAVAPAASADPPGAAADPPPAVPAFDHAPLRRALRDRLVAAVPGPLGDLPADPVAAAGPLANVALRPDGPGPHGDAVDDAVALATTLAHHRDPDPVGAGLDQLMLAVSLFLRDRLDDDGWTGEAGMDGAGTDGMNGTGMNETADRRAAAESLLDATGTVPPAHPLAATVLVGFGAFLDDRRPLDGMLGESAGRLAARAEAVLAAGVADGSGAAVVRALHEVCRSAAAVRSGRAVDAAALAHAVSAVPDGYPWLSRLRAAAGVVTGLAAHGRQPAISELAAALGTIGAAAMLWLHPAADRAGHIQALLLDPATERLELLGGVAAPAGTAAAGPAAWSDQAWHSIVEPLLRLGTRVVVATTGLPVPVPAIRGPAGKYAAGDLVLSGVTSGRQVVELAGREALPVTGEAVFLANPRGDRELATIEAIALRRLFYPHSTGLGRTVEQVHGAGTPAEVLAHLPGPAGPGAAVFHFGCGLATGPAALELVDAADPAKPAWLDAEQISAQAQGRTRTTGGLAILPEGPDSDTDRWVPFADALLDAGLTGVIGWWWPVPAPVATLMRFILHAKLVDEGLDPASAVAAVHRWMLDPDREVPSQLPASHTAALSSVDLTDPRYWAALCYRGR